MSASRLMWLGLAGPLLAFVVFFVTGYALNTARCSGGSFGLDGPTAALTAACALVAVLGTLASVIAWRRTHGDEDPRAVRIGFMATMGMTVAPLLLAIILMAGVGVLVLGGCVQS